MPEWRFQRIEISDERSFYGACDILHDASFDLLRSVYSPEEKKWTGFYEREYFEDQEAVKEDRRFLFFRHYTFPLVGCVLVLEGLDDLKVKDRARIERYAFNEVRKTKNGYALLFCENLTIELRFTDEPRGTLQDTQFLEKQGRLWSIGRLLKETEHAHLRRNSGGFW